MLLDTLCVLGIDPGTRITGWGVIEKRGMTLVHVDNGAIITRSRDPLIDRLKVIHDGLMEVIERHGPTVGGIESIFVSRNVSSALKLGHARGVAMLAAANHGLELAEFAPQAVKRAVVGTGRAEKKQVAEMVRMILGLPEIPQEDAADALAVAIARAHRMNVELPVVSGRRARSRRRG
jgi:crossover junction endodeoxyribonuclease RuvC